MKIRSPIALAPLGALMLLATSAAHAQAPEQQTPDLFGKTGHYDLTGSPLLRDFSLDYEYIAGNKPSYAELKGLAGVPTVEIRRNFVYVEDSDGSLTIPYQSQNDLFESFMFALRETYRVVPDEFVFVYLFTAFRTGVGAFFYAPEANRTQGINQQSFDQNGGSPREGFVFMNYYRSFEESFGQGGQALVEGQSRSVFNQEAGHRWCCFVIAGAGQNGAGPDILLGRDDSHWNFFMHSSASPMEGNSWRQNANGTFTTNTGFNNWRFSDMDLYLMGVLSPDEVAPFYVIDNPDIGNRRDLFGQPLTKNSTPQIIQPQTVSGTRVDIDIDAIRARNGTRSPVAGQAPNTFRSVFVILAGRTSPMNETQKEIFEGMVDGYADAFNEGSRGLASLDYILTEEPPPSPIGGPCTTVDDCNPSMSNVCLDTPAPGLCTTSCSSEAGCPNGWSCCESNTGRPGKLCLPSQDMCQPEPPMCTCDTTAACEDNCSCDPNCGVNPPMCQCNTSGACEANCDCDPDCGPPPPPPPPVCDCDKTFGCDDNADGSAACSCDPECMCACDKTFSCDSNDDGSQCDCDPECMDQGGCGCSASPVVQYKAEGAPAPQNTPGSSPLGFLGGVMLFLLIVRRKR